MLSLISVNAFQVINDVRHLAPGGALRLRIEQLLIADSGFNHFRVAFNTWAQSPEGVSLSFASFLLGGFASVARNAPKPLLYGIAISGAISISPLALNKL